MISETTLTTETSLQKESIFSITDENINEIKMENYLYGKIIEREQIITSNFKSENGGVKESIDISYLLTIETKEGVFHVPSSIDVQSSQSHFFFLNEQKIIQAFKDPSAMITHYCEHNYPNHYLKWDQSNLSIILGSVNLSCLLIILAMLLPTISGNTSPKFIAISLLLYSGAYFIRKIKIKSINKSLNNYANNIVKRLKGI